MSKRIRYSNEVKARAVRMVFEHTEEHGSQWTCISSIASKIGCTPETLRKWVRQSERDQGLRAGLITSELEELRQLKREVRELKGTNEILRQVAAFLPRRSSTANRGDGVIY